MTHYNLEQHRLAANTIRGLTMDAVQKANIGHPGMPMGAADMAVVLWHQFLRHNPAHPSWFDRDRFVLSAGHGSMLLYSLLHLTGYDLPLSELMQFRQWGSQTPGHPEYGHTVGVETTTGPLGQGISNAVGMALAEKWLAARFNKPDFALVNHFTYAIAGDGDLMEGVSHEAASLAGHLGLGKLIVLYDDNQITIDGRTDLSFSEDVLARFAAYGWQTNRIDGHDPLAVQAAITQAQADSTRPSLIACRTTIGYGSPNRQGTSKAHGEPLGEAEIQLTKEALGWPLEPLFYVPDPVYSWMKEGTENGVASWQTWQTVWQGYQAAYPDDAARFQQHMDGDVSVDWQAVLPVFDPSKALATRAASGQTINALAAHVPSLLGGSADLTGSNNTDIKGEKGLSAADFHGRYIYYGVREHAMGAIMNGLALHGGVRPYGGTFLVFSDYMRPTLRLAAMMGLPVIYVFTHDSIGLGEDGPTHQPIEHIMSLRTIPNLTVIRPADAAETAVAWQAALENKSGPTALILTRQGLPILNHPQVADVRRGGYVIKWPSVAPQLLLLATGSELHIALDAEKLLAAEGIATQLVSLPSWELFAQQSAAYQNEVLPPTVTARVSIEAGVTLGWERYIGVHGRAIGLDRFGASAPYKTIYEKLGLTAEAVAEAARQLLANVATD